jgi:hypothetical protein
MKRSRVMIMAILFLAVAAMSGAQDYGYWSNSELRAELVYTTGPHTQIKTMKVLSMRGDPEALDLIMALRQSPFLDVRLNALRSLSRYRDPGLLDYYEDLILDYENRHTVQERIVAIKGYVTINGWDKTVLEDSLEISDNPVEAEILRRAINGESFSIFTIHFP